VDLGVRRSLRSLNEFSFVHQRVSILLRKNKKTRAVGLFAIPLSLIAFGNFGAPSANAF